MIYPPGSLGHAYNRAIALREAERKAKGITWTREQKARDDWPRAWRWIGPAFGDYDPLAVVSEDLLALRAKVAERVSESEAFRVIKVWRALWAKLTPLGYTRAARIGPVLAFSNSAPPRGSRSGRSATFSGSYSAPGARGTTASPRCSLSHGTRCCRRWTCVH